MTYFNLEASPPNGGYAWLVVLAVFIVKLIEGASQWLFSTLYGSLLLRTNETDASVALIGSICYFFRNASGIVVGPMVKRYGCRSVGLLGGLLTSLGFLLSAFTLSTNIYVLYFTLGFLPGLGSCMQVIAGLVSLMYLFDSRRTEAMGYAIGGFGIGISLIGPLSSWFLLKYSLLGTLLIWSAISLHGIPAAGLFSPPYNSQKHISFHHSSDTDDESDTEHLESMLFNASQDNRRWGRTHRVVQRVRRVFVACVAKDFGVIINWFMVFCSAFAATPLYQFLIPVARNRNVNGLSASLLLVSIGISFVVVRFGCSRLGDKSVQMRLVMYMLSTIGCGLSTVLIVLQTELVYMVVCCIVYGLSMGIYQLIAVVLILDIIGPSYLEFSMGFFHFVLGMGALSGPPFVGWWQAQSGSYKLPMITLGCIQMLSGVLVLYLIWANKEVKRYRYEAVH